MSACKIIRALGTELGQMHADTAGREPDFEALLNRVVRNHPDKVNYQLRADALHNSIYLGIEILERAGLMPPEAVTHYAYASAATLLSGNERAFTPFDLSPDNIIVSHRISFLDYEWAGFRNVGFDVACVIAGFPQFLFARPISNEEAERIRPRMGTGSHRHLATLWRKRRTQPSDRTFTHWLGTVQCCHDVHRRGRRISCLLLLRSAKLINKPLTPCCAQVD